MKNYFKVILKSKCKSVLDLSLQVRDRATLYLNALGGDASSDNNGMDLKEFIYGTLHFLLVNLQASLQAYVSNLCKILLLDYK